MKVDKITDKIIKVTIPNREELAMTFLRFQEFYESPEFKDQIFTVGQFKRWYAEEYGCFSYPFDWSGFNIPSYVLKPFIQGLFDPLTGQERQFIDLFRHREHPFYIIGVNGTGSELTHEICHGLFYTEGGYYTDVTKVLSKNEKILAPVYTFVKDQMYHKSVWMDEVHAYTSADYDFLLKRGVIEDPDGKIKKVHQELTEIRQNILDK